MCKCAVVCFASFFHYSLIFKPCTHSLSCFASPIRTLCILLAVLVGLYELPEKPANAVDFIKEYLGAAVKEDTERLKKIVDVRSIQQQTVALRR